MRPSRVCLCKVLPEFPIKSHIKTFIFQHPFEKKQANRTDWVAQRVMSDVSVIVGRRADKVVDNDFQEAIGLSNDTALLFPSPTSRALSLASSSELKNLIVLDGTWKQVRQMLRDSPQLESLSHFYLELPPSYSGAFLIRKSSESIDDFAPLCTAEAVSLAIDAITGEDIRTTKTREILSTWSQQQITLTSRPVHRPDRPGYVHNLYNIS